MTEVSIRELTFEAFQIYGSYTDMLQPIAPRIGQAPIEFFRDMIQLNLGLTSQVFFSVCRVGPRPCVIDVTEMHSHCGEGILPLDGDIIIHVGRATPNGEVPVDDLEIFGVPQGTFVALRPGVWHHAPFSGSESVVNVLIVLPERTYANDCLVYQIPKEKQMQFRIMHGR